MHFAILKCCLHQLAFLTLLVPTAILLAADANHDGMDDIWQQRYGIAAFTGSANPDGDARINLVEAINFSDPHNGTDANLGMVMITDLDLDGLADGWQAQHQITAAQALDDPDGDGRKNIEESIVYSDPHTADTPWGGAQGHGAPQSGSGPVEFTLTLPYTAPGLRYTLEYSTDLMAYQTAAAVPDNPGWGDGAPRTDTCPTGGAGRMFFRYRIDNPDEDNDGVSTWHELFVLGSDPEDADSDGDGINDGVELAAGSSPTNPRSLPGSGAAPPFYPGVEADNQFTLVYQSASVSDSWTDSPPGGSVGWYDVVNGSHHEYYSGSPRWQAKLSGLIFPPGDQYQSQPWTLPPDPLPLAWSQLTHPGGSGYATVVRLRVVLRATQDVTQRVERHYLMVRVITDIDTGAKSYEKVGYVTLAIDPLQSWSRRYSAPFLLDPPVLPGKHVVQALTPVEFEKYTAAYGFDDTVHPSVQSVPVEDPTQNFYRRVKLPVAVGFEDQIEFISKPTGRLTILPDGYQGVHTPFLVGESPGPATLYIKWKPDDSLIGSMQVDVLKKTTRNVYLWRVAPLNGSGPTNVPTASDLQNYLNSVWGTQANAWFTVTDKGDHVVDFENYLNNPNIDGKVQRDTNNTPGLTGEMDRIYQFVGHPSVINLYFVSAMNPAGTAGVAPARNITFIQDYTSPGDKRYIASHEIGHNLGVLSPKHNNISQKNLMFDTVLISNPKEIRKQDWLQVERP